LLREEGCCGVFFVKDDRRKRKPRDGKLVGGVGGVEELL
jgi:hypothetical protein